MTTPSNYTDVLIKVSIMGMGSYFVWYFAGPLAGELGRKSFEAYYKLLYGTPSVLSWDYWFSYLPLRGHVSYYAYKYGDIVCATLAAPFFYKLSDMVRACIPGRRAINEDKHGQEDSQEDLNVKFDSVVRALENLSLAEREKASEILGEQASLILTSADEDRPPNSLIITSNEEHRSLPLNNC